MDNPLLDRMKRRQRDRRLDTLHRVGMWGFIGIAFMGGIIELMRATLN